LLAVFVFGHALLAPFLHASHLYLPFVCCWMRWALVRRGLCEPRNRPSRLSSFFGYRRR
jgi:hypothetical protein